MSIGRIPGDELDSTRTSTVEPTTSTPRRSAAAWLSAGLPKQLIRFTVVGLSCTTAYALMYIVMHPVMGAQVANFVAMLLAAILNTAANRAFTFGVRGPTNRTIHHVQGIFVFLFGWGLTALSLFTLHAIDRTPSRAVELIVLITVNLVATAVRFITFRQIFRYTPAD